MSPVATQSAQDPTLVFRALADPTRRAIFDRLQREGEQNVHALTVGARVSQPAVSKHLNVLRRAGLARARHSGRETFYAAEQRGLLPLIDWMRFNEDLWTAGLDRLDTLLDKMKKEES
jgi:DNA-binding transcriptional ArsR family regulator